MDKNQAELLCCDDDALATWLNTEFSDLIYAALHQVFARRTNVTLEEGSISHVLERLVMNARVRGHLNRILGEGGNPASYIYGVTCNVGRELCRRQAAPIVTGHQAEILDLGSLVMEVNKLVDKDRVEIILELQAVLKALPKPVHRAFREHHLEQRSFGSIAARMNDALARTEGEPAQPIYTAEGVGALCEEAKRRLNDVLGMLLGR